MYTMWGRVEGGAPVGDAVQDARPSVEGLRVVLVQLVAAGVDDGALRQAHLRSSHVRPQQLNR